MRGIVRIGAPASVEQSTQSLSVTILTAPVALAGAEAVAAYGIGPRLTSLVSLPAFGLARGTETVVGQDLGADQADRAKRAVLASSAVTAIPLAGATAAAFLYPEALAGVFITGESAATVIAIGADYLRIVGATFVFPGVFRILQGAYRGSGSTRVAMGVSVLGLILIRVPAAYVLLEPLDLGATGVWHGIAFSNVAVVLASLWFLRGTWTDAVVEPGAVDRDRAWTSRAPDRPPSTIDPSGPPAAVRSRSGATRSEAPPRTRAGRIPERQK